MTLFRMPAIAIALLVGLASPAIVRAEDARITVVAILGSSAHSEINPKLQQIAAEVRKHDTSLTGFKILSTECKDVNVGQVESFPVAKDISVDVTVKAKYESKNKIKLTVKPPMMGEVTYSVTYDKFMPIMTRQMANNERLIIAIMAQQPKAKDLPPK